MSQIANLQKTTYYKFYRKWEGNQIRLTIFCGASSGKSPIYAQKTQDLATWMIQEGHSLIFGGGKVGLMELWQIA